MKIDLDEVLRLPIAERIRLVEAIWDSTLGLRFVEEIAPICGEARGENSIGRENSTEAAQPFQQVFSRDEFASLDLGD